MTMLSSYRDHFINCALYVGVLAWSLPCWTSWSSWSVWGFLLAGMGSALSTVGIFTEIRYMLHRSTLPPGNSGLPFVGHLPYLIQDPMQFFADHTKQFGDPSTHNLLMIPCVAFVNDSDVNWVVTQERKNNTGAFVLDFFQRIVGAESIMFQSGPTHKRLRRIFEPGFTPKAIRDYAPTIDKMAVATLERLCHRQEFCHPREWALLAMRIFLTCAFGEADEPRMETLAIHFEGWIHGMDTSFPFALPFTRLASAYYHRDKLDAVLQEWIQDFKKLNPPNSVAAETTVLGRLVYARDENGKSPTEQQIFDNLRFVLFAGFDTTKGSFGSIMHYILRDQKVLDLLVEEAQTFSEPLDVDELKAAPVLNAALAEMWRLSAPLNSHSTRTKTDLEYKGYRYPKGTVLVVDTQAYHYNNSEVYPDGANFRIERWLPEGHPHFDAKYKVDLDYNVMSTKYRVFNVGPHMCLGAHFAKLEVRIIVARVLQKYGVEIRNSHIRRFPTLQRCSEFKLTEIRRTT